MWGVLKRLRALLNRSERKLSYALLVLIILAGLFGALGVSSILPFMAVVGNPGLIQTIQWLHKAYTLLAFRSPDTFLIGLGSAALVIMILGNALTLTSSTAILWFAHNLGHRLSTEILSSYIRQPYTYFLEQNTSHLVMNCTEDVARVAQGLVVPILQAIATVIVSGSILTMVLWVDPWLAVLFGTVTGAFYTIIFFISRPKVAHIGTASKHANRERFRLASEILNGIKELKILGQEASYQARFINHSAVYARSQWINAAVSHMPRHAIEVLAFGSVILLVIYLLATHQDIKEALPLLALYAFTGYRLLPAFQQLFASATTIRFNIGSLEAVEHKLCNLASAPAAPRPRTLGFETVGPPRHTIELKNVVFQYSNATSPLIRNLNLTIPTNMTVAIVGSSGGGKTTLVDVILGLLEPQDGRLLVDGVPITSRNVASWQKHLGYVPQQIYLADDTLAANIAFGVAPTDLDRNRVEHAARMANLHNFVVGELPDGYNTMVGDRGVRLSGGQRQRVGIARALYSDPEVLILDEATSALDGVTEDAVTEAIQEIFHTKTIIMVAHRLRTVRQADIIYLLDHGSVIDHGSYDELLDNNDTFRLMARGRV